ncbi:Hypothetical_protein [Hexamita inflata]|uniref:Hypothetical_protein n=1 Tax=Hexamita inflata TaxID=28002 RepID=A0AA86U4D0_9EUKA|nr:Hypothetical protein HINF_LOCUS27944 [Hexamita inflata]
MPKQAKQQFTAGMDDKLLKLVGKQMNFIEGGQDANVQMCYQRNKNEGKRLNIDFYWIDKQMKLKSYKSKAKSQCRFLNVLLPNALPEYLPEIQTDVHNFIENNLNENIQEWKDKNQDGRDDYRKKLEDTVKNEFNLNPSDMFSYKKLIDSSRHQIINFMDKEPLKTQPEQEQPQNVVQRDQENDHSYNVSIDSESRSINYYEFYDIQDYQTFEEVCE